MKKLLLPFTIVTLFLILLGLQPATAENKGGEENRLLVFKFIKLVESNKGGSSGVFIVKNNNDKDLYGFSVKAKFYEDKKYITWTSYSQFNTKDPFIKGGETKELTFLYGIASSINRIELQTTSTTFK